MSTKPLCVFRADAGIEIGAGHIMRCLALADTAKQHGMQVQFICRAHRGHLQALIQKRGHEVALLPALSLEAQLEDTATDNLDAEMALLSQITDADQTIALVNDQPPRWLIVDHYGLTSHWHDRLKPYTEKIMVIDDLARDSFNCDLLLNQNLAYAASDYIDRVPQACILALGPQYALLKPEFSALRAEALAKRKLCRTPRKVLVSIGGMDPNNFLSLILKSLSEIDSFRSMEVSIAVSSRSPAREALSAQAENLPFPVKILWDAENMAALMLEADYSIGAAGTSSWERCCLALPSILFVLADNQARIARTLAFERAAKLIRSPSELHQSIDWGDDYLMYAENAARICDGEGCARVADLLFNS